MARAIHTHSPRSGAPFVTVNSGSMPADLLESNLFGHVSGAFTGAVANKKGLFEVADGGSIFFDEIGTIPLETQAKLLRVIQEKEFMRVGSVETQKVDVAHHRRHQRGPEEDGRWRAASARTSTTASASSRSRSRRCASGARTSRSSPSTSCGSTPPRTTSPSRGLDPEAMTGRCSTTTGRATCASSRTPSSAPWCSARRRARSASTCCPRRSCQPERGELPIRLPENGATYKQLVEEYEKRLIRTALRRTGGVQKRAAELLKIKPTTLHEIIKRLEIRD